MIVIFLNPSTFQEYADMVFLPYLNTQFARTQRVDLVLDVHLPSSLKAATRLKRGTGMRKKVTASTQMPKQWKNFLRDNYNKTDLFGFLINAAVESTLEVDKELYATIVCNVKCTPLTCDVTNLAPCTVLRRKQICPCSCMLQMRLERATDVLRCTL